MPVPGPSLQQVSLPPGREEWKLFVRHRTLPLLSLYTHSPTVRVKIRGTAGGAQGTQTAGKA
jgi:hypothetical protein